MHRQVHTPRSLLPDKHYLVGLVEHQEPLVVQTTQIDAPDQPKLVVEYP